MRNIFSSGKISSLKKIFSADERNSVKIKNYFLNKKILSSEKYFHQEKYPLYKIFSIDKINSVKIKYHFLNKKIFLSEKYFHQVKCPL